MWNLNRGRSAWSIAGLAVAVGLMALLAGCGGASQASDASSSHAPANSGSGAGVASAPGATSAGGNTQNPSQTPTAQYLIKSLSVAMTAKDPRATATALQQWILATDPRAVSAGLSFNQDGASYDVSMTFSVEATIYPQIESYLAGYAEGHGGKLVNLQETVQNVTNDFVDSQSRLSNLRGEQQRLQTLMGQAGSLSDVLTIEQRLTDVEGQIEDIQTHLALLAGQTAYYTVQIQLTPLDTAIAPKPQAWNPGQVFGQAWGAAVVFGQWLLTLLIWLGVFALYIVPVVVVYWLARRLMARRRAARMPAAPQAS
jgi:uncharacterized protein DUF4349